MLSAFAWIEVGLHPAPFCFVLSLKSLFYVNPQPQMHCCLYTLIYQKWRGTSVSTVSLATEQLIRHCYTQLVEIHYETTRAVPSQCEHHWSAANRAKATPALNYSELTCHFIRDCPSLHCTNNIKNTCSNPIKTVGPIILSWFVLFI